MARTTLAERAADLGAAAVSAEGRVAADVLASARRVLQWAGERSQLSAEHTVVALAGGTGTGKSTLFNLLTGSELARTSQQRPTTAFPLAAVAESADIVSGSAALLEWLGVQERHEIDVSPARPGGLVLLDLPDHDSVVAEHRLRADRVTERADLLVWVTNPQKYADAVLHSRYLLPLAGHEDSVVVVLNQLDRLTREEAEACLADLRRLVQADGLRARIVGTSARTGDGVPQLEALIARAVERREAATARLTADVRHAASDLLAALPDIAPDARALADARRSLIDALEHAAGIPLVVDAVRESTRRDGIARTGWPPTRWVRTLRADPLRTLGLRRPERREVEAPASAELIRSSLPTASTAVRAQIASATRTYVAAAAAPLPGDAQERVNARAVAASAGLVDALDRAVVRTVEVRRARWWSLVNVVQWLLLAVAVAGGAWLGLLALLDYLRMPAADLAPTLRLGEFDVPWPTLLLVAGAAAGLVLALVAGAAVRAGARRRAARVADRLRDSVAAVAHDEILGEVDAELTALTTAREAARRAAR
ncbi:GTPase [Microbacterium sp. NPDC055455]